MTENLASSRFLPCSNNGLKTRPKRGFNLIEAAIVLAVVGLVIGGIWIAASAVQNHLRMSRLESGILAAAKSVYGLYKGQPDDSFAADVTSLIVSGKLAPTDWISGSGLITPIGSPAVVFYQSGTVIIRLTSVTQPDCAQIFAGHAKFGRATMWSLGNDNDASYPGMDDISFGTNPQASDCVYAYGESHKSILMEISGQ